MKESITQTAGDKNVSVDEVYNSLRKSILDGKLKQGDRIVERKLAAELGVSRTPIREAIRRLEQDGLIEQVKHRGALVASLSPRDVWEIYSIRNVLEGLAARLAAQRVTEQDIEDMEEIQKTMETAVEKGDWAKLQDMNGMLHIRIAIAALSPRLEREISNYIDYLAMLTRIGYGTPGRRREATNEHRSLIEAIKKGQDQEAEHLARVHGERSCEAYFIQLALTEDQHKK